MEKVVNTVAGDRQVKARQKADEGRLNLTGNYVAYLKSSVYQKYSTRLFEFLLSKGTLSPHSFRKYEELNDLYLSHSCDSNTTISWSDYFVIQALQPLVDDGTILDMAYSDEVMNNHAYSHPGSTAKMKSTNAKDNPDLMLDDDDLDFDDDLDYSAYFGSELIEDIDDLESPVSMPLDDVPKALPSTPAPVKTPVKKPAQKKKSTSTQGSNAQNNASTSTPTPAPAATSKSKAKKKTTPSSPKTVKDNQEAGSSSMIDTTMMEG